MATNKEYGPTTPVKIAKSDVSSGDHVAQNDLTGVSLTDTDDNGDIVLDITGAYWLSVTGKNNSGNVAVNVGDKIYDDSGTLNKDSTNGVPFGKALGTVASGATATILVLLIQA